MKRSSPPQRTTRPRPTSSAKRKAARFARVYGSKKRVQWIAARPCCVCHRVPTEDHPHVGHHITTGGMSRKADADRIVTLCVRCHAFEHGGLMCLSPDWWKEQADATHAAWLAHGEDA